MRFSSLQLIAVLAGVALYELLLKGRLGRLG
jgi:hypothetical protein